MPGRRCSACKRKSNAGYVSTYVAYYPEPDVRVGYRMLHCKDCWPTFLNAMRAAQGNFADGPQDDEDGCAACGTAVDGVWCVTYLTVYVPHQERVDIETWNCEPCAWSLRSLVIDGGAPLPDRQASRASARSLTSPWDQLKLA